MARDASDKDSPVIVFVYEAIGKIEKAHKDRYLTLFRDMESGKLAASQEKARWHCRNCSHIHKQTRTLLVCPACKHSQAYFERVEDHY